MVFRIWAEDQFATSQVFDSAEEARDVVQAMNRAVESIVPAGHIRYTVKPNSAGHVGFDHANT